MPDLLGHCSSREDGCGVCVVNGLIGRFFDWQDVRSTCLGLYGGDFYMCEVASAPTVFSALPADAIGLFAVAGEPAAGFLDSEHQGIRCLRHNLLVAFPRRRFGLACRLAYASPGASAVSYCLIIRCNGAKFCLLGLTVKPIPGCDEPRVQRKRPIL